MPKQTPPPMKQYAIRFPPPLIDCADAAADAQGVTRAEFIRVAVSDAVRHAERVQLASERDA